MTDKLNDLFSRNREWAAEMERSRPGFFTGLANQQKPKYMWIGCSDSRVPANEIIGLADNWLRHIQDVRDRHRDVMDLIPEHGKAAALCELNVIEQVINVAQSTVLQDAWAAEQDVTLHGWVYGVHDGLVQDLHMTVARQDDLESLYREAVSGVRLMPRNLR